MKTSLFFLLVTGTALAMSGTASAAGVNSYVEFLWSPTPKGAIARQETRGFVLDGQQDHQVCVAVLDSDADIQVLRIDAVDAAGALVSSQRHDDFRGEKRCYEADLDPRGKAGTWTFNIHIDGVLSRARTIEVAERLDSASFYAPSQIPYVLGRPNYDASIPPDEFIGRLVWVMHVNAQGAVTQVEVEIAEGVGTLMQDRAIAAGYLSLFPPDPSRSGTVSTYRRELTFQPDGR